MVRIRKAIRKLDDIGDVTDPDLNIPISGEGAGNAGDGKEDEGSEMHVEDVAQCYRKAYFLFLKCLSGHANRSNLGGVMSNRIRYNSSQSL